MIKNLIVKYLSTKFVRFVIVGLISAAIEYGLYIGFTLIISYQLSNVVSFALTNIVTFILSRKYVFSSTNDNKMEEAGLFILCLLGALLVSQIVLGSLVEYHHINDKIAKGFAIAVAVIWNYFTRKHIVFRNRTESPDAEAATVTEPIDESKPQK